jgi:hypothetical protein
MRFLIVVIRYWAYFCNLDNHTKRFCKGSDIFLQIIDIFVFLRKIAFLEEFPPYDRLKTSANIDKVVGILRILFTFAVGFLK